MVAAPVLVDKAIRITGSATDAGIRDVSPAVLTTELLSVGHRLVPSLDDRSTGFCAKTSPPNDETSMARSNTNEIFGE
jgi:hypothetical protein